MRRANHLFESIVDRENLRVAVHRAVSGRRSKGDARSFVARLDENLDEMRRLLLHGDYPVGVYHQFTIHDPKERLITAPCFRERVLHHAIMNVCEPVFERWLIADTFACRKGKGRVAALDRARTFSGRFAFFLKLDVRRYFDSISHPILSARLRRLFQDGRLLTLLDRIIAAYQTAPGRGLPIGSLTSQHFANFYLGGLDRLIKEGLRARGFVRYMDDLALWADTASELRDHLGAVVAALATDLKLEPKANPYINRTAHGLDFLGCRVFPDRLVLNRRSRSRFRRQLAALESAFRSGRIDESELQRRGEAVVAFARTPGLSAWRFRRRVIDSPSVCGPRPRTG